MDWFTNKKIGKLDVARKILDIIEKPFKLKYIRR